MLHFLHPVQGETVKGSGVEVRTTLLEEFALPPLEGLLELIQENPSRYAAKAYLEALPLLLHFEEMEKDLDGGGVSEEFAQNAESLDEGPAFRV